MPILPKHRDIFPGDLPGEPALATNRVSRWIPLPVERMLGDEFQAGGRLVGAVRFLNQGASIELEDVDLEPL